MPNWCSNSVSFYHDDVEQIKRAQTALADGRLFEEFVPCPEPLKEAVASFGTDYQEQNEKNVAEFGYASWYDFAVSEWGTKWDVECYSHEISEDGHTLQCSFDTAWSPPIAFYEKMKDLGFTINAEYYEPGVGFVGEWLDGDDYTYEIPQTAAEAREEIPEHLDENWGISSYLEDWEAENAEEDEE